MTGPVVADPLQHPLASSYVSAVWPGSGDLPAVDPTALPADARTALAARMSDASFDAWNTQAARVGYCSHPVRLVGSSMRIDSGTGEVLDEFATWRDTKAGVLMVPCGNRRADKCPACSRVYARDMFEVIRSGLVGGKTVPASVKSAPVVFATLTAPSFGHVHGTRKKKDGTPTRCRPRDSAQRCAHGRAIGCNRTHHADDAQVGAPLCGDCYDWDTAVVWQYHAPELWRRFQIVMKRALATRLGVDERDLRTRGSVQFARVAEYQARGAIHFHALVRLDGPDGPGSPAPLDADALASLVAEAGHAVRFTAPPVDADDTRRTLRFGSQLDAHPVLTSRLTDAGRTETLTAEQVAGYLAKYATKSAGTDTHDGNTRPHLENLQAACEALSHRWWATGRPDVPAGERGVYDRLGACAPVLGFRGHFSTRSRAYSVTLTRLRKARAKFARLQADAQRSGQPLDVADLEARLLADDEDSTLVVGNWMFDGQGWETSHDAALANAAADRARQYAQHLAEARRSNAA
ncbi:replication initiator [Promicromonospora sukumoe]